MITVPDIRHDLAPVTTQGGRLARAHGRGAMGRLGGGRLSALVAAAFGLPAGGGMVEAELTVRSGATGDWWTRRFGRRVWTTECSPTPTGFVEWIGPGPLRRLVGLDLAVGHPAPQRTTLRLRGLRLGSVAVGRPPGLRVDATVDRSGDVLSLITVVTLAGRLVLGYEGWIR